MTYRELYEKGSSALAAAGIEEAVLDARLLLEHVCHTTRNDLLVHGDRIVEETQEQIYLQCIAERGKRIPLQHITGEQDFMGLTFQVNEHVLIPRQDTEILVEEVLKELHDGMSILDMCTGSGCILISLLHYSNDCGGVGADISEKALEVARENAEKLLESKAHALPGELNADPEKRVTFLHSDLFEHITGKYDIIVSNPPYIRSNVIPTLMPEVKDHEPMQALDGMEDGLYFYKRIITESKDHLLRGGKLYFEIGHDQAKEVSELLKTAGFLEVTVVKDYAGLDRVVYGTYIE
uniref:peptide chain release factor N(5)-glutamine methyltransferase n=1 Tax=Acetatifactor sp. TaxID=1872090 RepID=UPI0040578517